MPTFVAAECFQTHQRLVPGLAPELSGTLEASLILSAGGFHRSAAQRFAALAGRGVIHAITIGLEIVDFLFDLLPTRVKT